jgi:hypothetical protein
VAKSFRFKEVDLSGFPMEDLDTSEEARVTEISTRQQRALEKYHEVAMVSFHSFLLLAFALPFVFYHLCFARLLRVL